MYGTTPATPFPTQQQQHAPLSDGPSAPVAGGHSQQDAKPEGGGQVGKEDVGAQGGAVHLANIRRGRRETRVGDQGQGEAGGSIGQAQGSGGSHPLVLLKAGQSKQSHPLSVRFRRQDEQHYLLQHKQARRDDERPVELEAAGGRAAGGRRRKEGLGMQSKMQSRH